MENRSNDAYFMGKTFQLARKAEGYTSPNPLVGAVIVENNRIIGKGYHKRCGFPHAEIAAMRNCRRKNFSRATLYINLEPCFHFGRTPPCVDAIINNKFKRVVIAVKDPNPRVQGKSIRKLKSKGVKVKVGVGEKEAAKLNAVFFKNMRAKRPFVTAKVAQSLDGKITTKTGISQWITGAPARRFSRSLRDKHDCVLIGINTVLKDDPTLNGLKKIPLKAVIDPHFKLPLRSHLLSKHPDKLIIFTSRSQRRKLKNIPSAVRVFFLEAKEGCFSLKKVLKTLFAGGITSVFVEGGSRTLGSFFDQKLVDKAYFFIAPVIIGGQTALTSIGAKGITHLRFAPRLKDMEIKRIKEDILISGYPDYE